ncbi:MAG: histidine kinase dimerization/phospho-acceptor domain-containing protein, partial [Usitatibacter sp.]
MAREKAGSHAPGEEIAGLRAEAARLREELDALREAARGKALAVGSNAKPSARMALLREANEKLVIATLQAQTATEVAERANRDKENFLAMLAHELRNPLAPIVNALAILRR